MKRVKIVCSMVLFCLTMILFTGCASPVASISIVSNSVGSSLSYGETFDYEEMVILVTYEDGTTNVLNYSDIPDEITVDDSSIINTTPGDYSILITYNEIVTSITVTVLDPHVVDFSINRSAIDAQVGFGTVPDWTDLIVSEVYADDTLTALSTSEYLLNTSSFNSNVAGVYTITVGYPGYGTKTFTVEVLAPTITGIEVDTSAIDLTVGYGVVPEWENLVVRAVLQDSSRTVLGDDDYSFNFGTFDEDIAGNYTIIVGYGNFTASFVVVVAEAVETGFRIDRSLISQSVDYGTTPDWSLLKVYSVFEGNSEYLMDSSDYSINYSSFDANTSGTYTIYVTYLDKDYRDITFNVSVINPAVTGFRVDRSAIPASVIFGITPDWSDLVVYQVFADESEVVLSEGYDVDTSSFVSTTADVYTISVTYGTFGAITFTVEVAQPHEVGFSIDRTSIPTSVGYGVTPNWSSLKAYSVFADSSTVLLSSGYLVDTTSFEPTEAGTYIIIVGYKSYAPLSFTVTVNEAQPVALIVDRSEIPTVISYGIGVDFSQLIVKLRYEDNSEVVIDDTQFGLITELDPTLPGTYEVEITYTGLTSVTFNIEVSAVTMISFAVDRTAIPTSVAFGSEIDWTNVVVTASYDDSSSEVLQSNQYEIDFQNYDNRNIGIYTIYVSVGNLAVQSFTVTVISASSTGGSYAYEGDTLVIFNSISYSLGAVTDVSYEDSTGAVSTISDGALLLIATNGYYTLNYTSSGVEKSKALKVVPWISSFGIGESLILYSNNTQSSTTLFISEEVAPILVGTGNAYYFDVNMNNKIIPFDEYIEYNFKINIYDSETASYSGSFVSVEDLYTAVDNETYGTGFVFNTAYNGSIVRATVAPRYNDRTPIVIEFKLNDGMNVFSDQELKACYGNLNVHCINIQRTIIASLDDNQKNADDGSPLNFMEISSRVTVDENGILTANNTGNIYLRYSNDSKDNELIVNGNYQTVDGSDLPLIMLGHEDEGQEGSIYDTGTVVGSQIAIFRCSMKNSDIVMGDISTIEQYNLANGNSVCYNNLIVVGNTVVPETSQGNQLLANSGSYSGLRNIYADAIVNNCIVKNTCIGLFLNEVGSDIIATDTYVYESWANLIYGHCSNLVQLTNCKLANAGGAAVWLEDKHESGLEIYNPKFIMDAGTIIDNYVSGTEAWFVAYTMAQIVSGLKSDVESGINPYGKTILQTKTYIDSQGNEQDVSKFNFTIVIMEVFDDLVPEGTMSGSIQIGDITVSRLYGTEPTGAEAFVYNQDVVTARVTELVTYYMSEADGSMSYNDALARASNEAVLENSHYLEVVSGLTGFGVIHTLMWMFDIAV